MLNLTPTEQKIYDLLSDGQFHPSKEIRAVIGHDSLDCPEGLRVHMYNLRLKLGIVGENIVGTSKSLVIGYIRVRNLKPSTAE